MSVMDVGVQETAPRRSACRSLRRAVAHTSMYSENSLSMCAAPAMLDLLDPKSLAERTLATGEDFRNRLRFTPASYEMAADIRGMGFFTGIEFRAPRSLALRLSLQAFQKVILTQICGSHFLVLKAAPPLNASAKSLDRFLSAIDQVLALVHSSDTLLAGCIGANGGDGAHLRRKHATARC